MKTPTVKQWFEEHGTDPVVRFGNVDGWIEAPVGISVMYYLRVSGDEGNRMISGGADLDLLVSLFAEMVRIPAEKHAQIKRKWESDISKMDKEQLERLKTKILAERSQGAVPAHPITAAEATETNRAFELVDEINKRLAEL